VGLINSSLVEGFYLIDFDSLVDLVSQVGSLGLFYSLTTSQC